MKFENVSYSGSANMNDAPSRKKPYYPINADLRTYLKKHGREVILPVMYEDLATITFSLPIKDKNGKDTHWEEARYDMREWEYIREGLLKIYAILKTEGN